MTDPTQIRSGDARLKSPTRSRWMTWWRIRVLEVCDRPRLKLNHRHAYGRSKRERLGAFRTSNQNAIEATPAEGRLSYAWPREMLML